jgi:hypothetical protein
MPLEPADEITQHHDLGHACRPLSYRHVVTDREQHSSSLSYKSIRFGYVAS